MTYPVDDAGNPRVDFVWGNMPLQPNDQRDTITSGAEELYPPNGEGNKGWSGTLIYPSEGLYETVTQRLSLGDQSYNGDWQDVDTRTVDVPADNHDIALTGWANYPGFIPNYPGDGDTGLEAVVPNVFNFTSSQAQAAVESAGFVYASTSTFVGAKLDNDGTAKSSSPVAGTKANAGSTVTVTFFNAPEVPNVLNKFEAAATTDLTTVGLVKGAVTTTVIGATTTNDGKVKTQSIAAGTTVNAGTAVALTLFAAPTVPNVLGLTEAAAESALIAANLVKGTVTTTGDGATAENDGTVKSQTPVSGGKANTGSAVALELYLYTP